MKREIVVNGRFLSRTITGVERYGCELLSFIGSKSRVEATRTQGVTGHLWEQFVLPTRLNSRSVLWSPANSGPVIVRDQALTIHDLSPIEHPEWFRKSFASWYRVFLPILAKRVRVIFTPSEYVRHKVIERLHVKNVIVTPNGVDATCYHPAAHQSRYELPEKYVLFVGSLQPRKNLPMLLCAWEALKDEYPDLWLIIVGTTHPVFHKVELREKERVRYLGYVAEDALPGIYANATLFVLPSFDEGFGLPALEAMASGVPVIVSNGGALPEVVGDAGLVFEVPDPDGLISKIRACLNDKQLRASLKQRGLSRAESFSWQKTAELVWNTLNEL
jgi:glycosyltransferase involved in cell wall biosynthesis